MSNFDAPAMTTTSIAFSPHCRFDRLRQNHLAMRDIADALGPYFLRDGQPACRRANDTHLGDLPEPTLGAPVLIGVSHADTRGPRWVVLGRTRANRRVHLVVAARRQRAEIITVWCPDELALLDHWHRHALLPTRRGSLSLPPTHWYFRDPQSLVGALVGAR